MNITLMVAIILFSIWAYPYSVRYQKRLGYDFKYYYEAAKGNLNYIGGKHDMPYIYHPYSAFFLKPLKWFKYETAQLIWYIANVICWLVLAYLLLQIKYGWVVVIFSFYPLWLNLTVGNVNPILSLLACNPLTAIVAVVFKPYYVFFIVFGYLILSGFNIFSGIVAVLAIIGAYLLYTTNTNLQKFKGHFSEEMFRKMNLIHLLPLYYWIGKLL